MAINGNIKDMILHFNPNPINGSGWYEFFKMR